MSNVDEGATGYAIDPESVDSMQLDGEAVVLNLKTHVYFGLNTTATEVWELIKAHPGISRLAVAGVLRQRREKDPGSIEADVASVIDGMLQHGLLHACEPSTPHVQVERDNRPYAVPTLEAYGDLDTLILSGE
jgi:hypothetical protein